MCELKFCRSCEESKDVSLFYNDRKSIDGKYYRCKLCSKNKTPVPEKVKSPNYLCKVCNITKSHDKFYQPDIKFNICMCCVKNQEKDLVKKCTKCKVEKILPFYSKNKNDRYGKNGKCKECVKKSLKT